MSVSVRYAVQAHTGSYARTVAQHKYTYSSVSVVHVTIYLSKYEQDFATFNQAYAEGLPKDVPPPVRICVGVAALYAGTDVELSVVSTGIRLSGGLHKCIRTCCVRALNVPGCGTAGDCSLR